MRRSASVGAALQGLHRGESERPARERQGSPACDRVARGGAGENIFRAKTNRPGRSNAGLRLGLEAARGLAGWRHGRAPAPACGSAPPGPPASRTIFSPRMTVPISSADSVSYSSSALASVMQLVEMLGQDLRARVFGLLDQAADLLVDQLRGGVRDVLALRHRVAEEHLLLVLAVAQRPELLADMPNSVTMRARQVGGGGCRRRRRS